jgi:hypothetical protein
MAANTDIAIRRSPFGASVSDWQWVLLENSALFGKTCFGYTDATPRALPFAPPTPSLAFVTARWRVVTALVTGFLHCKSLMGNIVTDVTGVHPPALGAGCLGAGGTPNRLIHRRPAAWKTAEFHLAFPGNLALFAKRDLNRRDCRESDSEFQRSWSV